MLGDKIKELRLQNGMTQQDLATYLQVTPKAVSFYELNQREPSIDALTALSKKFGVPIDYLLNNEIDVTKLSNYAGPIVESKKIPIIGSVRCGPNGLAFEEFGGYVFVDEETKGEYFAFICRGDSMKDVGIHDGDLAIVRKQDDVESGEIAVVVINGDEGTLKRVRKFDGGIILEAANPAYEPRVFTATTKVPLHIVGKVLEVRKKL